jgi:hypothetical protein
MADQSLVYGFNSLLLRANCISKDLELITLCPPGLAVSSNPLICWQKQTLQKSQFLSGTDRNHHVYPTHPLPLSELGLTLYPLSKARFKSSFHAAHKELG